MAFIQLNAKSSQQFTTESTIYIYFKKSLFKAVSSSDIGVVTDNSTITIIDKMEYSYYSAANSGGGLGIYFRPWKTLSSNKWFRGEIFCAYDVNTIF